VFIVREFNGEVALYRNADEGESRSQRADPHKRLTGDDLAYNVSGCPLRVGEYQREDVARRDERGYGHIGNGQIHQEVIHGGTHYPVTKNDRTDQAVTNQVYDYQEDESGGDAYLGCLRILVQ